MYSTLALGKEREIVHVHFVYNMDMNNVQCTLYKQHVHVHVHNMYTYITCTIYMYMYMYVPVGRQVVKTQWVGSVEEGRGEQGGREGEDVWAEAE